MPRSLTRTEKERDKQTARLQSQIQIDNRSPASTTATKVFVPVRAKPAKQYLHAACSHSARRAYLSERALGNAIYVAIQCAYAGERPLRRPVHKGSGAPWDAALTESRMTATEDIAGWLCELILVPLSFVS